MKVTLKDDVFTFAEVSDEEARTFMYGLLAMHGAFPPQALPESHTRNAETLSRQILKAKGLTN